MGVIHPHGDGASALRLDHRSRLLDGLRPAYRREPAPTAPAGYVDGRTRRPKLHGDPPTTTATLPSNGRPIKPPLTTPENYTAYNSKSLSYSVYLNKEVVSTWDKRKVAAPSGAGAREPGRRHCRAGESSTQRCGWWTKRGWAP